MNMQSVTAKPAVAISGLNKTYDTGFTALKDVNLDIKSGEIFALLGPNGAGKTTLIGTICGLVRPTSGQILVGGHDVVTEFRKTRAMIGLVPQELTGDRFETVWATVSFTRGLFGKPRNDAVIEKILRDLSLWEKRNDKLITLSGGMKRRVLIAKALSHEPKVLFLDEPTAGVDVELRRDMWNVVRDLREKGVTIILTTHYIEEAEEMADRIGVISKGEIILVEEKSELMAKLGKKDLSIQLQEPLETLPAALAGTGLTLAENGEELIYSYDSQADRTGIASLIAAVNEQGIRIKDLSTRQSSLEDIFIGLLRDRT
ncbi:ABC transporter ATP-binding protein [Pelagibacterium sp. 26DY04]|uniref:ABC transporter ATP-binding protein n=1 Tax=unclassified Pelagibacterium TaxID=2623280 RepID=UPI002815268E|nr:MULTISPECIES: ABC transporter ATP-binding protein [unclassified Pelagibacterium]WMT88573.1 ABC transporter ATP-binding protein [Pelagibacterium sp. 26DY04]WMT90748.1 ABC transporter ATP-binding protein [Pelagibacterium sp. H642]